MKVFMKKFLFALPAIIMALAVSACREEPEPNQPTGGEGGDASICFTVGNDDINVKSTSNVAEEQIGKIRLTDPNETTQLFLVESVSNLDSYAPVSAADTKGTPVYTENFGRYESVSTIPYPDNGYAKTSYLVDKANHMYRYDFGTAEWPTGQSSVILFMSVPCDLTSTAKQYGCTITKMDPSDGSISFSYESPAKAEDQIDVLFTSKTIKESDRLANPKPKVLFYHALAGVKFKSGNAQREDGSGNLITTVVTGVELESILADGTCKVTPNYEGYTNPSNAAPGNNKPKSAACSIWTAGSTYADFSIENPDIINGNSKVEFPDSFYGTTATGKENVYGEYNLNATDYAKTFFFVPQTTGEETVLRIKYKLKETSYNADGSVKEETLSDEYSRSVVFSGQTWDAGNIYTYTLTANNVAVSIDDKMTDNNKKKTQVVIKNTGNVDAYMRVAIVANWYDLYGDINNTDGSRTVGYHQIVAPWGGKSAVSEGSFDWFDTENWKYSDPAKGGDGYYYYKYVVKPGYTVKYPIFGTFTVGKCPIEFYAQTGHLEMDLAVQAFDASKVSKIEGYWDTSFFLPYGEESSYDPK